MANSRAKQNVLPAERCLSAICGAWLVVSGARKGLSRGKVRFLIGVELLRRGISGHSFAYQAMGFSTNTGTGDGGIPTRVAVTIGRPREEVFRFWRDFANLPQVMSHVVAVDERGNGITRWTIRGPLGIEVGFDAEVVDESENEYIAWRSLPEADVSTKGSVKFLEAPSGYGTEIHVEMQYTPPAGRLGHFGAKLSGRDARSMIEADCWRLKEYLETGEIATTDGQPTGPSVLESRRRHARESLQEPQRKGATE